MSKFYKQLLFIILAGVILTVGGLIIKASLGNLKINPILGHDLDLDAKYYAQAGNNTVHDITTQDISVSAWVKVDVDMANYYTYVVTKAAGASPGYWVNVNGSSGLIELTIRDAALDLYQVVGTTNIKDNKWHYITAIIDRSDATQCKVYLDGINNTAYKSGTLANVEDVTNIRTFNIGNLNNAASNQFDGQIRDVKLYYAAGDHWSDAQVLYQAQHPFDYSANAGTLTDYWRLDEGSGTTLYGKVNNLTLSNVLAWTTQPKIKMVRQENTTTTSNNPVGWWKMDEGSSSSTLDSSGNGNTGTLTGGVQWTTGKLGKGLSFDGVNDYVDAGQPTSLNVGTGDLTVEIWIKIATGGTTPYVVISNRGGTWESNTAGWEFRAMSSVDRRYSFIVASSGHNVGAYVACTPDLNDGRWHHLVAVLDRDVNGYIYTDGVLTKTFSIASLVGESISGAYNLNIGHRPNSGTYDFSGSTDDVRIYNRALSAGEVGQMYNSTKDGYLGNIKVSTGLVGYWKLDDNNALTSVIDYSGKGNTGTAYSGTATSTSVLSTSTAMVGRAMSFDGVDDWVNCGVGVTWLANAPKTFSAWIKTSTNLRTILYDGNAAYLYIDEAGHLESWMSNGGFDFGGNLSNNNWHFIAWVYNGSTEVAYIDGVLTGASNTEAVVAVPNQILYIGRANVKEYFNGLIDEVKIWNYARTAEQINQDYRRGLLGKEQ